MSWFSWTASGVEAHGAPPPSVGTDLLARTQPGLPTRHTATLGSAPTLGALIGPFREGEVLEYFSASLGQWIPAKVLAVNVDGTYNLDCKPQVTADKLRRSSVGRSVGAIGFQVGDIVEYYGVTQGKWILAKVLSVTPTGLYNLDCKPEVPADRIRRPEGTKTGYKVGDKVEYFGASAAKWIAAMVTKVNTDGTYDLDVKPAVTSDRIRVPCSGIGTSQTLGTSPALGSVPSLGSFQALPTPMGTLGAIPPKYREGDSVEYFGATANKWIPAKVLRVNLSGTYDLDCKPDVGPERIRPPQGPGDTGFGVGVGPYKVGDIVDYYSTTQKDWIPAKVVAVNVGGTFDLDCKPQVTQEKIRPRSSMYQVGDIVEYSSTTEGRWIPARVNVINSDGSFDLSVKPRVTADKIRRLAGDPMAAAAAAAVGGYPANASFTSPMPTAAHLGCIPEGRPLCDLDAPIQLLRIMRAGGRWRFEVSPEGARSLELHGTRRLAVASICGLYRTGKSFLLNLLSERMQKGLPPFQVGNTTRACTEGLWLWGCADDGQDKKDAPLIVLVDCEGFGNTESDRTRDAQLMTLCSLLSSVLLLNTKGSLNEGLFAALSLSCRFAEHVEERGNEANRPSLLWVLRDFMLDLKDTDGRPISPDDYLERALHSAPGSAPSSHSDTVQASREGRQSLMRFFARRSCCTLLQPVAEESQLQRLAQLPYHTLRKEFREGVEDLRSRVISDCKSNVKAVCGQPLNCVAFVALLRQLVVALNESKMLSVRGAWETVQHTACGQLADELRSSSQQLLHALASGQRISNHSAQLPMTDEALRQVLREQRHILRGKWEDRAVGEELVRQEYWQELKESLAREEALVRQKNSRLADQQLAEALKSWQEWLDNDKSPLDVDTICSELGQLMDRMPAGPLGRAGKAAVASALRRVVQLRQEAAKHSEIHGELHRKAIEGASQAAQQEGAARSELEAKRTELEAAKNELKSKRDADEKLQADLLDIIHDLAEAKDQLDKAVFEVEAARAKEHELKAKQRAQADIEAAARSEIQLLQAAAAKANGDRLASERFARAAADLAASDQRRLEVEVEQAKLDVDRICKQLSAEQAQLAIEHSRAQQEHEQKVDDVRRQLEQERNLIKTEKDKTKSEAQRMLDDVRSQYEEERIRHAAAMVKEDDRHREKEGRAAVLEGQVKALTAETSNLKQKVASLEAQARESEALPLRHADENARRQKDVQKAKAAADAARALQLEKLAKQAEEHARIMEEEEKKSKASRRGPWNGRRRA